MVQEFHVLQCFSCQSFQVQQVKKANRWSCKLCGEKQSQLKEFGRGSGADCRRHVQKLNAMRGAMMEEQEHNTWSPWKQVEADREDVPEEHDQVTHTQVSRWSKYLDTPEEAEPQEEEEGNVLMDRQQLHGNNMIDRKRKRREGWTDRGGQGSWTPKQSKCSSLMMKHVRPSTQTVSPDHTICPNKKSSNPPSVSAVPVRRWANFLSLGCQVKGDETLGSGWSQPVGRAASMSCDISQPLPLAKPRPLLPVSSMFESGDKFNFDS